MHTACTKLFRAVFSVTTIKLATCFMSIGFSTPSFILYNYATDFKSMYNFTQTQVAAISSSIFFFIVCMLPAGLVYDRLAHGHTYNYILGISYSVTIVAKKFRSLVVTLGELSFDVGVICVVGVYNTFFIDTSNDNLHGNTSQNNGSHTDVRDDPNNNHITDFYLFVMIFLLVFNFVFALTLTKPKDISNEDDDSIEQQTQYRINDTETCSSYGTADLVRAYPSHGSTDQVQASLSHGSTDQVQSSLSHGSTDQVQAYLSYGSTDQVKAYPSHGSTDQVQSSLSHGSTDHVQAYLSYSSTDQVKGCSYGSTESAISGQSQHGMRQHAQSVVTHNSGSMWIDISKVSLTEYEGNQAVPNVDVSIDMTENYVPANDIECDTKSFMCTTDEKQIGSVTHDSTEVTKGLTDPTNYASKCVGKSLTRDANENLGQTSTCNTYKEDSETRRGNNQIDTFKDATQTSTSAQISKNRPYNHIYRLTEASERSTLNPTSTSSWHDILTLSYQLVMWSHALSIGVTSWNIFNIDFITESLYRSRLSAQMGIINRSCAILGRVVMLGFSLLELQFLSEFLLIGGNLTVLVSQLVLYLYPEYPDVLMLVYVMSGLAEGMLFPLFAIMYQKYFSMRDYSTKFGLTFSLIGVMFAVYQLGFSLMYEAAIDGSNVVCGSQGCGGGDVVCGRQGCAGDGGVVCGSQGCGAGICSGDKCIPNHAVCHGQQCVVGSVLMTVVAMVISLVLSVALLVLRYVKSKYQTFTEKN